VRFKIVPDSEIYDVIIVGGGPAGLSAALYCNKAMLKTLLLERATFGGQVSMTKGVDNYLGLESIAGFDLSERFLKHAQSYGLEIKDLEVENVMVGSDFHSVTLGDGRTLRSQALILATGGTPRKLNIPGENRFFGRGVSYCAKCDGFFFLDQTIVVIGGGDSAVEEALYLSKIASQVHIVHRGSELRAGGLLKRRLEAECKIRLHLNTIITEIQGNETGVYGVSMKNLRTQEHVEMPTDGVFIFVGLIPSNKVVPQGLDMSSDGYVITNEKCETNIPGILVAGDLRRKYANQIVIAAADGCVAAIAAAEYVGTVKSAKRSCPVRSDDISSTHIGNLD
jgi:thioredoxin reductase (NADPH)